MLKKIPLSALAKQTGWMQRTWKKIAPLDLVTAAMLLVSQPQISLTVLAVLLGLLSRKTVSKQAVDQRLRTSAALFVKRVLAAAIGLCLQPAQTRTQKFHWPFARVLVQDSTTLKLNQKLAGLYPGGANQHGQTLGVLRVQAIFDLLSQRWVSFALSPYVHNDQKASPDVLPHVHKNDLVLRDLGCFAVRVLEQIVQRGAFFLSRFYFRTAVFDAKGQPVDLRKLLRREGRVVDQWVRSGKQEQMPMRLVAFRVPARVANERRRKARAHLQNRCQLSAAYLELQNWTILLTNVPAAVLSARQVRELYGQRWQIEIIFKGWKSHFHLEAVSCSTTAPLLEVAIYGKLLFITLTHPWTAPQLSAPDAEFPARHYSRLKVNLLIGPCLLSAVLEYRAIHIAQELAKQVDYHGRYEKRKRKNIVEKLLSLA